VRRQQVAAPGCPQFKSKDSVLLRPNGDPATVNTVCPGLHVREAGSSEAAETSIVWWDPRNLKLDAEPPLGIRRSELIVKDIAPQIIEAGLADYRAWRDGNDAAVVSGSRPSIAAQTVTQWAKAGVSEQDLKLPPVEIIELPREPNRPSGRRFGALVHAVLGSVPLDGDADVIQRVTALQGRTLGATDEEVVGAAEVVQTVLAQPLLQRARHAAKANRCRRETPVVWRDGKRLVEGVVDLAFEEEDRWTLVDFKTDEEIGPGATYQRQVGLYASAVEAACARPVSAFLLRI
jgi:ATP-dependent helicase/nuclease subunit A